MRSSEEDVESETSLFAFAANGFTSASSHAVSSGNGTISAPPFFCFLFLFNLVPFVISLSAACTYHLHRWRVKQTIPLSARRSLQMSAAMQSRRGSIFEQVSEPSKEVLYGLRSSQFGNVVFVLLWLQLVIMHCSCLACILVNFGILLEYDTGKRMGCWLLAVPGTAKPLDYTWDANAMAFFAIFAPCVLLTMAYSLGGSSLREVWLRMPENLKDADSVNVVQRIRQDDAQASDHESCLTRTIHKFLDGCADTLGMERFVESEVIAVKTVSGARFLDFRSSRRTWSEAEQSFVSMQSSPSRSVGEIRDKVSNGGLSPEAAAERLYLFGDNAIEVSVPTVWESIVCELSGRPYLYQLFFSYVFFFAGSVKNGCMWSVVFVMSAFAKALVDRQNKLSLCNVCSSHCEVTYEVLRSGELLRKAGRHLVPGDVIKLPESGQEMPVDAYLVKGSALIDESVVTGEATPVQKFPVQGNDKASVHGRRDKKHYLFAGTSVLQGDDKATAVVADTGANTLRGQLVVQALYPSGLVTRMEQDYRVVVVLTLIFGLINAFYVMELQSFTLASLQASTFCVFNVLSPLLPVVLVMGQTRAAERLRREHGILSVTPARAAVAGRVTISCFDKTGTLTEDGLSLIGCLPAGHSFQKGDEPLCAQQCSAGLRLVMGLCHNLATHTASGELAGPQVELAMFEGSRATALLDGSSGGQINHVTWPDGAGAEAEAKYPFDHNTMTMSMIATCNPPIELRDGARYSRLALVKGAPENVAKLCKGDHGGGDGGESAHSAIVRALLQVIEEWASRGYYVLMAACRPLEGDSVQTREDVEQARSFEPLGLLVFRNELRAESQTLISDLRDAYLDVVIVSGDSHQTAAAIAKQVGVISDVPKVLTSGVVVNEVRWRSQDDVECDPCEDGCQLIVSGEAWQLSTMHGRLLPPWLKNVRVFGRVSPEQKTQIVEAYISMGHTAMFVGDGGNDSGALRAAHVGVALTVAKEDDCANGSVIAHFNTTKKTPSAALHILLAGRCALSANFACFCFLFCYGIQLTALKVLMNSRKSGPIHFSSWQLILFEGMSLPCMTYALLMAGPLKKLHREMPPWSLLCKQGALALVGPCLISLFLVVLMYCSLLHESFFVPFALDKFGLTSHEIWKHGDNFECATVFLVWSIGVLSLVVACGFGGKFRTPLYYNAGLIVVCFAFISLVLFLTWRDSTTVNCLFRVQCSQKALDTINKESASLRLLEGTIHESSTFYGMGPTNGNILPLPWRQRLTLSFAVMLSLMMAYQKFVVEAFNEKHTSINQACNEDGSSNVRKNSDTPREATDDDST